MTTAKKVDDAQADIDKANDLFLGENYSRMLFSIDLPNESEDTTEFVGYLYDEVKKGIRRRGVYHGRGRFDI